MKNKWNPKRKKLIGREERKKTKIWKQTKKKEREPSRKERNYGQPSKDIPFLLLVLLLIESNKLPQANTEHSSPSGSSYSFGGFFYFTRSSKEWWKLCQRVKRRVSSGSECPTLRCSLHPAICQDPKILCSQRQQDPSRKNKKKAYRLGNAKKKEKRKKKKRKKKNKKNKKNKKK